MSGGGQDHPSWNAADFARGRGTVRHACAQDLRGQLQRNGYIFLTGNALAEEAVSASVQSAKAVFDLPTAAKEEYMDRDSCGQRGYTGYGPAQAIRDQQADRKELWHVGRELSAAADPRYPANIWPHEVPEFKTSFLRLFVAADTACATIMEALDVAFDWQGYLDGLVKDGNSVIRLLHYPISAVSGDFEAAMDRAAPHQDIDLFTVWLHANEPGLQFQDRDGVWRDIHPACGEIAVASGEMLALITGGAIPSVPHRVRQTDQPTEAGRYSIVFFLHPHPDAVLRRVGTSSVVGGQITAKEFFERRIAFWSGSAT